MATILIVARGLPSVIYPSLELARRLAVAGHRLTFASLADARTLVAHVGLDFLPLEESRYEQFLDADARTGAFARILHVRDRRTRAKAALGLNGFVRALRTLDPDLVLVNGEMHEHIIVASALGVPMVLLNTFVSIWRRPGLPPPHHAVRPGTGWKGSRLGISLLWRALRLRKWLRAWSLRLQRVGCDRLALLRLLADESGFDLRRETDTSQWLIPFTYRHFPVFSLHALEFEFPHCPPTRVTYVGPMVLEQRVDHPMTPEDGAVLDAVVERRRQHLGLRRLIYAAFGSVLSTDLAFLKRLLGVVSERPQWELVVSLSGRVAATDLGPLPERVHVFPWAPQLHVLSHADVAVTHGGVNTIDECVIKGVPTLVYCGRETDMAGTTARVVQHGIGIAGDRQRDGTKEIRAHIERLLNEPQFLANVRRLQRSYATYVEGRVAERAVDSLLESRDT